MKPLEFLGSSRDDLLGMPAGVRDASGAYRAMYVAKFEAAVYVLHAFQKKTPRTAKADIELAKVRCKMIGGKP
jgi:phage-related protein